MIREARSDEVRPVQMAVLRPNGPLPGDSAPGPGWRHVAADVDGQVIGTCTVGPSPWPHPELCALPSPQWQLRSMAVLPPYRGGTGTALLAAAVRLATEAGAASLWADARVAALNLYLRGGWEIVGDEWMKPGIGPHRWIVTRLPLPESAGQE